MEVSGVECSAFQKRCIARQIVERLSTEQMLQLLRASTWYQQYEEMCAQQQSLGSEQSQPSSPARPTAPPPSLRPAPPAPDYEEEGEKVENTGEEKNDDEAGYYRDAIGQQLQSSYTCMRLPREDELPPQAVGWCQQPLWFRSGAQPVGESVHRQKPAALARILVDKEMQLQRAQPSPPLFCFDEAALISEASQSPDMPRQDAGVQLVGDGHWLFADNDSCTDAQPDCGRDQQRVRGTASPGISHSGQPIPFHSDIPTPVRLLPLSSPLVRSMRLQ
eukprot:NODE_9879_length_1393_cov_6.417062.p1 GENE.NODE_9879_length_1393_cov_6.417062~~NODE_9879_length_1393_cov_6.417062.p1  ORF type:complete len:276 (-),score=27.33 NODE_9879_length_1393_cov_6.417062:421-1248(-)